MWRALDRVAAHTMSLRDCNAQVRASGGDSPDERRIRIKRFTPRRSIAQRVQVDRQAASEVVRVLRVVIVHGRMDLRGRRMLRGHHLLRHDSGRLLRHVIELLMSGRDCYDVFGGPQSDEVVAVGAAVVDVAASRATCGGVVEKGD